MSLLPVCGKIFERLIYNSLFEFFIGNELISSNQSGFKAGDSCINQLLPVLMKSINLLMMDMKLEDKSLAQWTYLKIKTKWSKW